MPSISNVSGSLSVPVAEPVAASGQRPLGDAGQRRPPLALRGLVRDPPLRVDATGSMGDEIDKLKRSMRAVAKGIKMFAAGASGLDPVGEYVLRQAVPYTGGRFVCLTCARARDQSRGPGRETAHELRHDSVETLDALIVRLVREEVAACPRA